MITILKKGYKTKPEDRIYYKKCSTCGCEFTYQNSDIEYLHYVYDEITKIVYCPDCKLSNNIIIKRKYKEKKYGKRI